MNKLLITLLLGVLLYIYYYQLSKKEEFSIHPALKNPYKHINKLKRKLRIMKNNIHKKHIYPLKIALRKKFM